MKELKRFLLAVAAVALMSASAFAQGTGTINLSVSATVSANCTISTSALAFGSYDPVSAKRFPPALDGTGGVTVTCTNGAAATITLGQGTNASIGSNDAAPLRRLRDSGTNYISYSLYQDSGRSAVWGNTAGTGVFAYRQRARQNRHQRIRSDFGGTEPACRKLFR